jgi:hypothetical protein
MPLAVATIRSHAAALPYCGIRQAAAPANKYYYIIICTHQYLSLFSLLGIAQENNAQAFN